MVAISVLVPTYKRPDLLGRCLASLAEQDVDATSFEVVAVDDGSGDATPRVLEEHAARMRNLRGFSLPANAGPAAARNRAINEAAGDLVLFVDDDIVAPPSLVATHLRLHDTARGDRHLGVLGRVDWHPDLEVTPFMHWLDTSGLQFGFDTWLQEGPVVPPAAAFYTCNLSMHRDLLAEVGAFDERFPYPAYEDMELAWRLERHGFRLEYRPEAQAFHARAIDLATFRARMAKVAESAALLRRVQPDFPIDETQFEGTVPGRTELLRLRLKARRGDASARARLYRAEIRAGYQEGRARAADRS
jgi:glycosyltransferase involved in cell wall biosynthesis